MTENGNHTTYLNGDFWGMVYGIVLPYKKSLDQGPESLPTHMWYNSWTHSWAMRILERSWRGIKARGLINLEI